MNDWLKRQISSLVKYRQKRYTPDVFMKDWNSYNTYLALSCPFQQSSSPGWDEISPSLQIVYGICTQKFLAASIYKQQQFFI